MTVCKVPKTPKTKKPTGSDKAKRISKAFAELEELAGVVSEKQRLESTFMENYAQVLANLPAPTDLGKYNKVQSLFARKIGWQSAVWQAASLNKTPAGRLQYELIEKAKLAKNIVNDIATYESLPKVRRIYEGLKNATGNSLEEGVLLELLHDHIIIGQFPKLRNIYPSQVVHTQLLARYQRHIAKLENLGITPDVIKQFDQLAGEISGTFDKIRFAAGKFGLGIDQLANGGYFPIQALPEISRIFDKAEAGLGIGSKVLVNETSVLNETRKSLMPIVLDTPLLAKALGAGNELELAKALTEPGELTKLLSKFSEDEIEQLFSKGILGNMPALSDELMQFFNKELGLPIKNLGQAIILDPEKAIKKYTADLERGLQNSNYYKTAIDEGIRNGWVVTEADKTEDFVRIGRDTFFAKMFGNKIAESAENLYMHRTVLEQVKSLVQMNTNLEVLGVTGSALQQWISFTAGFNKAILLGTGFFPYFKRVFLQNVISLNAAVGSEGIFQYSKYFIEYTRSFLNKSIDNIADDFTTKFKDGTSLSRRELFKQMQLRRLTDFSAGLGEQVTPDETRKIWDVLNKESLQRMHMFNLAYYTKFGSPVTGKKFASYVDIGKEIGNTAYKQAYEYLARTNQHMDIVARWAAIDMLSKNPMKTGRKQWTSLDELIRYSDEYFGINENVGELGAFARYLVPFASFSMAAPGSALRHAIRNPWQYSRMMQLYSYAQHAQGKQLTEEETAQWQKDGYILYLGRNSEGKLWGINPGSVDFYLDSTLWVKENLEKLGRGIGLPVGSEIEQFESKANPTADTWKGISESFDKFIFADPIKALIGVNPETGTKYEETEQTDAIFGAPIDSRTKDFITSAFPVIKSLDKALPISGRAPLKDSAGFVVKAGEPGLFGGTPRNRAKEKEKPNLFNPEDTISWVANNVLGLNLSEIDAEKNVIRNYSDLEQISSALSNEISRINQLLLVSPEDEMLIQKWTDYNKLKGAIEYNKILIRVMQQEKGYNDVEAIRQLKRKTRNWANIEDQALRIYLEDIVP